MKFDTPLGEGGKELWVTEYNLKNGETAGTGDNRLLVYQNGFTHGYMILEWFLKNIKINYDNDFRERFFTIATLQSFVGPNYDMLSPAQLPVELSAAADYYEALFPDIDEAPYSTSEKLFYKKHIIYFVMELVSEIRKNDLDILKMNGIMLVTNPNLFPTIFIDPAHENLYIYYSNVRPTTQCYRLNPLNMDDLFPGCEITFGTATITGIKALQPYSTSGFNSLFIINEGYDLAIPYPVEITETFSETNDPDCPTIVPTDQQITVPAQSFGYIKVPIETSCRLENNMETLIDDFIIYPNPTSGSLMITSINSQTNKSIKISIISETGQICMNIQSELNKFIDVSNLSAGLYQVRIQNEDFNSTIKYFVKL